MANYLIVRKLIVDDRNELFDAQGMKYAEFASDLSKVRQYATEILSDCSPAFLEGNLLEQQLSELIKNGMTSFDAVKQRCSKAILILFSTWPATGGLPVTKVTEATA